MKIFSLFFFLRQLSCVMTALKRAKAINRATLCNWSRFRHNDSTCGSLSLPSLPPFPFAFLPVCPCHHHSHLTFSYSSYRPPAVVFLLSTVFSFIPALPFSWIIYALGVGSHCGMLFEPQPQYYSMTVDVLEGEREWGRGWKLPEVWWVHYFSLDPAALCTTC